MDSKTENVLEQQVANEEQPEPLEKVVRHLLEESRMVLPGIQALFGFQFVAVFNQRFSESLSPGEQKLHLIALALVAVAVVLVLTPAAYHRQAEPRSISERFVRLSGYCLTASMVPLMLGACFDFYIVSRLIIGNPLMAAGAAGGLFVIYAGFWFALPQLLRRSNKSKKFTPL